MSGLQSDSSTNTMVERMLLDLPQSGAFSSYDGSLCAEEFQSYVHAGPMDPGQTIRNEKTRCLIRALKPKTNTRKRQFSVGSNEQATKRRKGWSSLEREKKQACMRLALVAATKNNIADECLKKLKRGWMQDPKRKQLVNAEVRLALCRSLMRWSIAELKEYLRRAGAPTEENEKMRLVNLVHQHLAPENQ